MTIFVKIFWKGGGWGDVGGKFLLSTLGLHGGQLLLCTFGLAW